MTPENILAVIAVKMVTDPNYTTYIALASQQCSVSFFGTNWALAVALLAAHMWTLNAQNAGQAGIKTYEANGRLMQSFGGMSVIDSSFKLTNYGLQYLSIRDMSGVGATTASLSMVQSGLMG